MCPQQRYVTREPGKVQGRDRVGIVEGDLVRVVGIVAPFAGFGTRGKFVYWSPVGKIGTGDLRRVSPAAVRHGRARQN